MLILTHKGIIKIYNTSSSIIPVPVQTSLTHAKILIEVDAVIVNYVRTVDKTNLEFQIITVLNQTIRSRLISRMNRAVTAGRYSQRPVTQKQISRRFTSTYVSPEIIFPESWVLLLIFPERTTLSDTSSSPLRRPLSFKYCFSRHFYPQWAFILCYRRTREGSFVAHETKINNLSCTGCGRSLCNRAETWPKDQN